MTVLNQHCSVVHCAKPGRLLLPGARMRLLRTCCVRPIMCRART